MGLLRLGVPFCRPPVLYPFAMVVHFFEGVTQRLKVEYKDRDLT